MRELLFSFTLSWLTVCAFGQQTTYEYPVTPRSAQWAQLNDYAQKRAACQLPETVLRSLSTPQLVEAVLDYPLIMDLFVFRDLQTGFDNLRKNFNGIGQLYSRTDRPESLRQRYTALRETSINALSPLDQGNHSYRLMILEILLAQREMTDGLGNEEVKKVLTTALVTFQRKKQDAKIHGEYGLIPTVWLIARVLEKVGDSEIVQLQNDDPVFKAFLTDGLMILNSSVSEKVIELAQKHVSK